MKYIEQLRYSWSYHWGVFREIWDMFTHHNWHWLVVGLLIVFCVVPSIAGSLPSSIPYYVSNPVPSFAPSLSQELAITDYLSKARPIPSIPAVVSYYWVRGSGFNSLASVLSIASAGLLLTAYLREGSPARGDI